MATHHIKKEAADPLNKITESDLAFVMESNRIEGINRMPKKEELLEFDRFMELSAVTVDDLVRFVAIYQPGAKLRDRAGLNVIVGGHRPPPGGKYIRPALEEILEDAERNQHSAYMAHLAYETLHPFTDGNGRSGRMLWMWQMKQAPLGFLHQFYYQTLRANQ